MWKIGKTAGIISVITLIITVSFSSINIDQHSLIGWIFPETVMLKSFDFTDLIFAEQLQEGLGVDTNIVLVNIGQLDRKGIAEEIEIIHSQKPKVIGIDCSFRVRKDPKDDSLLAQALSKVKNLVLYSRLTFSGGIINEKFDSVTLCHPYFAQYGKAGYCNLKLSFSEEYSVLRYFRPTIFIGNHLQKSFAIEVASLSDSTKVKKILERENELEVINYRGNLDAFYSLDVKDVLGLPDSVSQGKRTEIPSLKDKIVLMGFMGNDLNRDFNLTIEDKFHTPMNPNFLDRSVPDMFGLIVQANIISMILHENYIDVSSQSVKTFSSFILCLLHVWILLLVFQKLPEWYDLLSILLLVFQVVLFSILRMTLFVEFNYKMNFDLTIGSLAVASVIVSVYHITVWKKFFNRIRLRKKF